MGASKAEIERAAKRPMAFFPHDSNAADDIKCRRLIRREGAAGYGRWWRLCELLASADGHRIDTTTDEDLELLAESLMLANGDDAVRFLQVLSDVGLIDGFGTGQIWSERMDGNALYFGKNRANGGLGGRPKKERGKGDKKTQ